MNRPLTRKEWLAFLEKTCDEFDWESAGQKRELVDLTDEKIDKIRNTPMSVKGGVGFNIYSYARAIEAKLKEKNNG